MEIIKKIKNSHAFGRDNIDAATVKAAKKYQVKPITHVVNLSLGTSRFPAKWKIARILPLKKSREADNFNPASFRPVSQLPVISKITERIVQSQLLQHLEKSGLLSGDHHAYQNELEYDDSPPSDHGHDLDCSR